MSDISAAQDLIYLVSCAVNEEKPNTKKCRGMNLPEVFKLARCHSLTVAAACALEQVVELPGYFKEEKLKAIRRLSLYDVERAQILSLLEQRGIWYLPLKGIVLRQYYPKIYLREMSDNDILCDSGRMADVKDIMEHLGYACKSYEKIHHDVYEKLPFIEFEMHRSLFDRFSSPESFAYYGNMSEKLVKDDNNLYGYHMTDEDMYIFLICHLYKHYKNAGTGLRSLLDLFVFNKKHREQLNSDYLNAEFNKLNLTEFEYAMRRLAEKTFSRNALSEDDQTELSFIIESNTHGTLENVLTQYLKNDDSGKAKRKYALNRIFPDSVSLKIHHPIVYRHKALYPFLVVYRPIKGILFYRKIMLGEIKRLNRFKKKDNGGKFNE